MELKVNKNANKAFNQIIENDYKEAFLAYNKPIYGIGISIFLREDGQTEDIRYKTGKLTEWGFHLYISLLNNFSFFVLLLVTIILTVFRNLTINKYIWINKYNYFTSNNFILLIYFFSFI